MSRYDQILSQLTAEYKDMLEGKIGGVELPTSVEKLDSPIEKILFIQLKHDLYFMNDYDFFRVYPQFEMRTEHSFIRVDFLIEVKEDDKELKLIIECDGHDFHEKTKEQAQKDKSRDRFLAKNGYVVMRFTGSEIYKNPRRCIKDIDELIAEKIYGEEIRRLMGG